MIERTELRDGCPRTAACAERHMTQAELATRWRISVRTLECQRQVEAGSAWLRLSGRRVLYPLRGVLAFEQAHMRRPCR